MGIVSSFARGLGIGTSGAEKGYGQGMGYLGEGYQQARADLDPYRKFYGGQLKSFSDWLATPGGTFRAPTMEEVSATPGYQFRLREGQSALENAAAARGGLLSGNTGRALQEYGQQYATGEYGTAYDRAQREYQNELAKRMGFLGMGQSAATGSAGLASQYGQGMANLAVGRGQSQTEREAILPSTIAGIYGIGLGKTGQFNPMKWLGG